MTVKDLKRKLDLIPKEYESYKIFLDVSPGIFIEQLLEKVYVGGAWNVMLSSDVDDEDIEDNKTPKKVQLKKLNIGDTFKHNLDDVGIFKVLRTVDENWIESVRIQSGRIAGNFPWVEVYPVEET